MSRICQSRKPSSPCLELGSSLSVRRRSCGETGTPGVASRPWGPACSDAQRGSDMRAGTVIPNQAIKGTVYSEPNKTYGKGPYIAGKNSKYIVTATTLNWEVAYPISHLLSGGGVLPSSNVWGIIGKNVTALLAIETTELDLTIPGLADGSKIHVVVWDKKRIKTSEETVTYKAPFKRMLREYDFLLIDKAQ